MSGASIFPDAILLATANSHKAAEIKAILAPLLPSTQLLTLSEVGITGIPEEVEAYGTFAENALSKAVWCRIQTGLHCIADDSGICVDALNGAPGVRSARWAGPTDADRNAALLAAMENVGAFNPDQHSAHFTCATAFSPQDGEPIVITAELAGVILPSPSGKGGFGYDPLFLLPETGLTLAEVDQDTKNRVSHRARALRKLAPKIASRLQSLNTAPKAAINTR